MSESCAAYRAQTGRDPDILAALGFHTARVIDLATAAIATPPVRAPGLAAELAASNDLSPRGVLTLDPALSS